MDHNPTQKPLAVYVHWPWCKAKCPYCDFNSHGLDKSILNGKGLQEELYVDAVCREVRAWGVKLGENGGNRRPLASIFFGGGTPSLMRPDSVAQIIKACGDVADLSAFTEITVECNPTSSPRTLFDDLKAVGVNRVSVGIQGLKPEWLAFLGRAHSVEQALETLEFAQNAIGNVNADVIYGLPGQQLNDWQDQLQRLSQLGLSHLSAYQLTVEPNTRFYADVRRGVWEPIDGDLEADFFEATQAILTRNGYENYEISNFARPGKACAHNLHVWRYGDYLGVGAGAHGRITLPNGIRLATAVTRQPDAYLRRMEHENEALNTCETANGAKAIQEALFLGLRLAEGIDLERLVKTIGQSAYERAVDTVELTQLQARGFLLNNNGRLRLTATGWPRLSGLLKRILRRDPLDAPDVYQKHPSVLIQQQLDPQE